MKGYREIRAGETWDGDVIAVNDSEYYDDRDFIAWRDRFRNRKRYWIVDHITNNGNIRARDAQGKPHHINLIDDDFIQAYRRA